MEQLVILQLEPVGSIYHQIVNNFIGSIFCPFRRVMNRGAISNVTL